MNQRTIILAFIILCAIGAYAQNTEKILDSTVSAFTKNLKKEGISKIGFTKHYCIRSKSDVKETLKRGYCNYGGIYYELYLFWQDKETTFLKKFDNCGVFNQVEIKPNVFFEYYLRYKDKIKIEMVEPMKTREIKGKDTTYSTSGVDHSCHRDIVFYGIKDTVTKFIDFYDLNETGGFDDEQNLNLESNLKLKIVEWDRQTSYIIAQLEKKNKFKRITGINKL